MAVLVQVGNGCLFGGFGDGCGGILPKHKTLAARGLQYVFAAKVRQILGFLADGMGIGRVLVQMFVLQVWGRCNSQISCNLVSSEEFGLDASKIPLFIKGCRLSESKKKRHLDASSFFVIPHASWVNR